MAAQFQMLPQDPSPKQSDEACFRMLQALLQDVRWVCLGPTQHLPGYVIHLYLKGCARWTIV